MSTKIIHIEKYDIKAFEKEQKPYVMVLTDLIQRFPIQHSKELHLWMFLESLPPTWKPNKNHITAHFNISDRTYERYMSYLNATNLIEYRQIRSADGTFGDWKLIVLNGTKFNPDAVSSRSAKIDGTVVNRVNTSKVIHISEVHRSANFGGVDEPPKTRASIEESSTSPFRQKTVERSNDGHINTTHKKQKGKKKTNNPVSVFSDSLSVKNHVEMVVGNRNVFVEDEIIEQVVFYSFEQNEDRSFDSVNKRINIALKKVREGQWKIPQGFKGITSQSIRQEEEEYNAKKQSQFKEDAIAMQNLGEAFKQSDGFKAFQESMKKLKEGSHDDQAHKGTMQKQAV